MAQQTIQVGTTANDRTGTDARSAGNIINANFTELYIDTAAPLSGDVVKPLGSKVTTIAANAVGNSKLAQVAAGTLKGNATGLAASPSDLSVTQVTAMLNVVTSLTKGLVPQLSGNAAQYFNGAGGFSTPASGGGGTSDTRLPIFNASGITLIVGAPFYISGYNSATGEPQASRADADGVGTMAVTGLVLNSLATANSGVGILAGQITGIDTTAWALNDPLYVSIIGLLTNVMPVVGLVQEVARVSRVDVAGTVVVGIRAAGMPIFDTAAQLDVNGNPVLQYGVVAAAVNRVEVRNAATGAKVRVSAVGADANVGLHLARKGTGVVTGALQAIPIAVGDETTALTAGVNKVTFRMPFAFTLTGIRASVTTAPTGATLLTVDVNEGGVSVISTKLTFDATEKTTVTAVTAPVISDAALADDAEITIDIDAIGNTIAGAGLKVYLIGFIPE